MPGFGPRFKRAMESYLERTSDRKKRKEDAMEAKKVKVKDETDMLDVQGAKDGGRMGYKNGSKCKMATKGKGRAYGKNS